jgi:hypothetical protein
MGFGAFVSPSRIRMPMPPQKSTTFITQSPFGLCQADAEHTGSIMWHFWLARTGRHYAPGGQPIIATMVGCVIR